jgi:hypothetical protein
MRSFLAALWLLTVADIARAEFDAAGVASAKPKATQATGAAFERGMLIKPPVEKSVMYFDDLLPACPGSHAPQPVIKNPSNIPRPKP